MNQQAIQRTRYLLQTRFRRLRGASIGNFEQVCKQVLDWLEKHPVLSASLRHLEQVTGEHHSEIRSILQLKTIEFATIQRYFLITVVHDQNQKQQDEPDFKGYTPANLEEHASACLLILRATMSRPEAEFYRLLAIYLTQENYDHRIKDEKQTLDAIKDIAVRDLYEYLDEHLDAINAVNGILQKYKQNVEWFQRKLLQQINQGFEGKTGERALALHLQQYVFNQGVEFVVEPTSASGEVDLLLRDSNGEYTIIDAKYIKPNATQSEIVRKIAEGFNQIARYCEDFNQHEGFLAIFVHDDISIMLDVEQNDSFRYFRIGGNVIYYVEVNISDRPSASKSGKTKQIHISQGELIEETRKSAGAETSSNQPV